MTSTTFDILMYAKKLREAGMPEKQAEVQAEALKALEERIEEQERIHFKTDSSKIEKDVEHVNDTMNYFKQDVRDLRGEVSKLREESRADFRWLLSIIIAGIVGLAGLMAHGFHWF